MRLGMLIVTMAGCSEGTVFDYALPETGGPEADHSAAVGDPIDEEPAASALAVCLAEGGELVPAWSRPAVNVTSMEASGGLLALRVDGELALWDAGSGAEVTRFGYDASPLAWQGDAVVAQDWVAGLSRVRAQGETDLLPEWTRWATDVASDGDRVAVLTWDRLEVFEGEASTALSLDFDATAITWTEEGLLVAAGLTWGTYPGVRVWDPETSEVVGAWDLGTRCGSSPMVVGLTSGQGTIAVLGTEGGYGAMGSTLYLLDASDLSLRGVEQLDVYPEAIEPLGRDGFIISGYAESTDWASVSTVWDYEGRRAATLEGGSVLTTDGTWVLTRVGAEVVGHGCEVSAY